MTDWQTIPQMVLAQAQRYGKKVVLRAKRGGSYRDISWKELVSQVQNIALSLIDFGVQPGDRVALLSENRPEWAIADVGIQCAGGVTVPIYITLAEQEIEFILKDAGVRVIFVSTPELMAKVLHLQESLDLRVVLFDAPYRIVGPRVWWLGELVGLGRTASPMLKDSVEQRLHSETSESLASIIYTSGTTGSPKGVMLTHDNFLSNCQAIAQALPITEADSTLSFLPLSHVFERTAGYYFVLSVGGTIAYAENMEKVGANLLEARPTIVTGVPRFYEKLYARVQETARTTAGLKGRIMRWAFSIGNRWTAQALNKKRVSPLLVFQLGIADRLVFSKLRDHLGGRLRFCISGGAPLSKEIAEFFYGVGIMILEGYGLTETSPVITCNRPERFRFGSVGIPLAGVEVRIAEDGEILTRGPLVMKGYFNQPEATAEAIDKEGWLHTGDIGMLDADGFLFITDRKKDLIKTSGGKMVAPQNLENALKADPLIADCVVIGDKRKYITALVVPNSERLEGTPQEKIRQMIGQRVEALNKTLAPFEQIKKFTLLAESFTLASGELTPTLKVKRRVIAEKYASQIDAMYLE